MNGLFVTVHGVIGTEPAKSVWNGEPVLTFRMVNNERRWDNVTRAYTDAHSSWMWVNCYGDLARNVSASVGKGDRVIVHGKLRVKDSVSTEGENRTSVNLVADAMGPDLKFATARVRVTRRRDDVEEQLDRHAEEVQRALREVPRQSFAELVAQRASLPDDDPDDGLDDLDDNLGDLDEQVADGPAAAVGPGADDGPGAGGGMPELALTGT